MSVSGSPVTSTGTLALSYSGTALPAANGGTGATSYTAGQLLIGNSSGGLTKAFLTEGSGVSITKGNGSITISATGTSGVGTFSGGGTGLTPSTATTGNIILAGTLVVANGGTGSTTASGARTNLGLGTVSTLNSVSLTTNVTGTLPLENGGTNATTASGARTSLGLGSIATQESSDYVALAGTQTITGQKTFTGGTGLGAANPDPTIWNIYSQSESGHPAMVAYAVDTSSISLSCVKNGNGAIVAFYNDPIGSLTPAVGSINITATGTTYDTASDYRLKDNATLMLLPLTKSLSLKLHCLSI